jgi:hypothetical protein
LIRAVPCELYFNEAQPTSGIKPKGELVMRSIKYTLPMVAAAIALAAIGSNVANAQTENSAEKSPPPLKNIVGQINDHEAYYVDGKTFQVAKGKTKGKEESTALIQKLRAAPLPQGAIIFRAGDKLYLAGAAPPQLMYPNPAANVPQYMYPNPAASVSQYMYPNPAANVAAYMYPNPAANVAAYMYPNPAASVSQYMYPNPAASVAQYMRSAYDENFTW